MSTTPEHDLTPGQVWADNDPRSTGRTLRVDHVVISPATGLPREVRCTVVTAPGPRVGHRTTISVERLRPTSRGYRLVSCPGCTGCAG